MLSDEVRSQYLGGRSCCDHPARVQHDEVIRVGGGQVKIMDDGHRCQTKTTHSLQQVNLVTQVEMIRGFVQEQDLRILGESSGQLNTLPLPSREGRPCPVSKISNSG